MSRIHGTCVAIDQIGVLLLGPPGCGKSDLALRLIDGGAALIADDQVELNAHAGHLIARPPEQISGLLEVRGLGVFRSTYQDSIRLGLAVDLEPHIDRDRLPRPVDTQFLDIALPTIALDAFQASAAARTRLAVKTLRDGGSIAGALGDKGP